jgi:hypothetical protein
MPTTMLMAGGTDGHDSDILLEDVGRGSQEDVCCEDCTMPILADDVEDNDGCRLS